MSDLREPVRLRQLIQEYGRLQHLQGHTPQSRGRRFNGLLAEALECWGINAQHDQRSTGEIDVQFALGETRFILEAKWKAEPSDTGDVAKLQRRVRQRLAGTVGILASISGFSQEALQDLKDGERLEVLLIDQEHIEALIAGLVSPSELMDRILDQASFTGDFFVHLSELLRGDPEEHHIRFGSNHDADLVSRSATSLHARTLVRSLPFGQSGVFERTPNKLWVTTPATVIECNIDTHETKSVIDVSGCHRNPSVSEDGEPLFLRREGAAVFHSGRIRTVAGGLSGNSTFVTGTAADNCWIFCNSLEGGPDGTQALLVNAGSDLGTQDNIALPYPSAMGMNALAWEDHFVITGNAGLQSFAPDGNPLGSPVDCPAANPMGVAVDNSGRFYIAAGDVQLFELDPVTLGTEWISDLNLRGAVSELATASHGGIYLYSHPRDDNLGVVVHLSPA